MRERKRKYGLLGRHDAGNVVTFVVAGRANYLYVTIRNAARAQTVMPARNDAGVPHSADLPVEMRVENKTTWVIVGTSAREDLATVEPTPPSGVPIHTHAHHDITELTDDDHTQYLLLAGRAGGQTVTGLSTGEALKVTRDLTAASTDSPVVNVVQDHTGDDQIALRVQQDGTGKILSLLDGASEALAVADGGGVTLPLLTAKTTPVDADGVLIRDSAAASVVKETTWANIKATLKTYFDTLYDAIGAAAAAVAAHAALTVTHGATGAIVGTTNTQTLTDKTLASPIITGTLLYNSGTVNENYREDVITIADIGSTQVLTIDITHASDGRPYITTFEISLGRGGSNTVWALGWGWIAWTSVASGSAVIRASDASFTGSGTVTGSITAITNGVRITLSSTAFGNVLNQNMVRIAHTGFASQNNTHTITVT